VHPLRPLGASSAKHAGDFPLGSVGGVCTLYLYGVLELGALRKARREVVPVPKAVVRHALDVDLPPLVRRGCAIQVAQARRGRPR
jgi:hypothetical protein